MDQHVRVLGDIVHDVIRGQAKAVLPVSPHVLGAPVPAFPAVGVAHGLGVAAHQLEEVHHHPMDSVNGLGLAVPVTVRENAERAVLRVDALELVGDERRCLVPTDADKLALAAVLRIALAVGVPVDAFERVLDAVRGVDPLLVREMERRQKAFQWRLVGDAVLLQLVLPQLLLGVPLLVMVGAYPDDLSVLDVNTCNLAPLGERALPEGLEYRLICDPWSAVRSVGGHPEASPSKLSW